MSVGARTVQLIRKLPNDEAQLLPFNLPSSDEESIDYHLVVRASEDNGNGYQATLVDANETLEASPAAILNCRFDQIVLCCRKPSTIYVTGVSWRGTQPSSIGREQLRPNDTFFIDDIEFSITLCETMAQDNLAGVKRPPVPPGEKQPTLWNTHFSSSQAAQDPEATSDEIPSDGHPTLERGSQTSTAMVMKDSFSMEDHRQDWLTDVTFRSPNGEVSPSPPPASDDQPLPFLEETPSKAECQDSIDPRAKSLHQISEPDLLRSEPHTDPGDGDVQVKDDTQASNIRHPNGLVDIPQNNEPPSSPMKEETLHSSFPVVGNIAVDRHELFVNQGSESLNNQPSENQTNTVNRQDPLAAQGIMAPLIAEVVSGTPTIKLKASKNVNRTRTKEKSLTRIDGIRVVIGQRLDQGPPSLVNEHGDESESHDGLRRNSKRAKIIKNSGVLDASGFNVPGNESNAEETTDEEDITGNSAVDFLIGADKQQDLDEAPVTELWVDENIAEISNILGEEAGEVDKTSLSHVGDFTPVNVKKQGKPTAKSQASSLPPKSQKPQSASRVSLDPSPPAGSTRSTPRNVSPTKLHNSTSEIKVLFANSTTIDTSKAIMKFLTSHRVQKVNSVQDCTVLCVKAGAELKRTSKLIMAVLGGKTVVTDEWITESVKAKKVLELENYLATDPPTESEWGTTLVDAVARGRDHSKPFQDWSLCFTPAVKKELGKGFVELKEICIEAGAKSIQATLPRKGPQEPSVIIMIGANEDKDVPLLQKRGWKVFGKELITFSILRGTLQYDTDEFLIEAQTAPQPSKGKKRKR